MKKFKTSAEKKELHDTHLEHLLADKKLLHNALVNYSHAPLGLIVGLMMSALGILQGLPVLSQESFILAQIGVTYITLFYMFKAYAAFDAQRQKLAHVRNQFVGSFVLPVLFSGLLLFMGMAFNWKSFLLVVIGLGLAMATHFHLKSSALQKPLAGVYFCLPLLVPALAVAGPSNSTAWASTATFALILFGFSQLQPKLFLINS